MMVAEMESAPLLGAAEPDEGHVQSVLSVRTAPGPQELTPTRTSLGFDTAPPEDSIPTVTRQAAEVSMAPAPSARFAYAATPDERPANRHSSMAVALGAIDRSHAARGTRGRDAHDARGAPERSPQRERSGERPGVAWCAAGYGRGDRGHERRSTSASTSARASASASAVGGVATDAGGAALANAATPARSTTATVLKPVSKPVRTGVGGPARPLAPATAVAPPGPDCTTTYWFDAQGSKHYKPECLDE